MLTKKDKQELLEEFSQVFVTKTEFNEFKREIKHDLLQFKDDILWEIKAMREELAITTGYRAIIEDHEIRIVKLEKLPKVVS